MLKTFRSLIITWDKHLWSCSFLTTLWPLFLQDCQCCHYICRLFEVCIAMKLHSSSSVCSNDSEVAVDKISTMTESADHSQPATHVAARQVIFIASHQMAPAVNLGPIMLLRHTVALSDCSAVRHTSATTSDRNLKDSTSCAAHQKKRRRKNKVGWSFMLTLVKLFFFKYAVFTQLQGLVGWRAAVNFYL